MNLLHLVHSRNPVSTVDRRLHVQTIGIGLLANDARKNMGVPVTSRPQVLVTHGIWSDAGRLQLCVQRVKLSPGGRRSKSQLGEDVLVVPNDVRDVLVQRKHHGLAVNNRSTKCTVDVLVGYALGLQLIADTGCIAIRVTSLEAITTPLEVDIGSISATEQTWQTNS